MGTGTPTNDQAPQGDIRPLAKDLVAPQVDNRPSTVTFSYFNEAERTYYADGTPVIAYATSYEYQFRQGVTFGITGDPSSPKFQMVRWEDGTSEPVIPRNIRRAPDDPDAWNHACTSCRYSPAGVRDYWTGDSYCEFCNSGNGNVTPGPLTAQMIAQELEKATDPSCNCAPDENTRRDREEAVKRLTQLLFEQHAHITALTTAVGVLQGEISRLR